jgi:hypothetical protein
MKFAVKKARAINQIQSIYKKKDFFEFDQKLFWEGLLIK